MLWMKYISERNSRHKFLDFGNGKYIDNIIISFYQTTKMRIYFTVGVYPSYQVKYNVTDDEIPIGEWFHLAVTYKSQEFKLYINSSLKLDYKPDKPIPYLNKERSSNFIGGSNMGTMFDGVVDEMKIFGSALSNKQVEIQMH